MRLLRVTSLVALTLCAFGTACSVTTDDDQTGSTATPIRVPPTIPTHPLEPAPPSPVDRAFRIQNLGTRCVDAGLRDEWKVDAPVTIRDCDNSRPGQSILIHEIDSTHDVELRVGTFCIGVVATGRSPKHSPTPSANPVPAADDRVVLQTCSGAATQRFALDGDAIMVGFQQAGRVSRELVLEPQHGVTEDGTPLVVGTREVLDSEYFLFQAVDGSNVRPTTGFVTVATEAQLDAALLRGWGTVIEVSNRGPLDIAERTWENDCHGPPGYKCTKIVGDGITIRGNRLRQDEGGTIVSHVSPHPEPSYTHDLFYVLGHDIRITGLRLFGPSASTTPNQGTTSAVQINEASRNVIVDRNEMAQWTGSGVGVIGPDGPDFQKCPDPPLPDSLVRDTTVRIIKNSVHTNRMEGLGYGVAVGTGAYPLIQGNYMMQNRHCITASGHAGNGYRALDNIFLRLGISYGHGPETDVDVHGSIENSEPAWYGGTAGDQFEVGFNTFLGNHQSNVFTRGDTCRFVDVHDNVARHIRSVAFNQARRGAFGGLNGKGEFRNLDHNEYGAADPTLDSTAVGDFDGDGKDDVFLATGAGWYFSPGGRLEWRFLNRMRERTKDGLLLADLDGDGRTDVITAHGRDIVVSWAGLTPWHFLNMIPEGGRFEDLGVGFFDGDKNADLFFADGREWFFASGGRNWQHFADAAHRTKDLRFGDFNQDGRTDVLGILDGRYVTVSSIGGMWQDVGPALTSNMDDVFIADFDGDGKADVGVWRLDVDGFTLFRQLKVSLSGTAPLVNRGRFRISDSEKLIGVGNFDGVAGADVLWSEALRWNVAAGGFQPSVVLPLLDMR